jgi:hypothetical protein
MPRLSSKRMAITTGSLLMLCFLVLTGCAATQVQQVWKDQNYQEGRLNNVFVIAMVYNDTARRMFESEFAKKLNGSGIKAVESFRSIEMETLKSAGLRDAAIAKIRELGCDALLLSRVVDSRTKEEIIPGMTITTGFGMYGGAYVGASYSFNQPAAPTTQSYSHEQKFMGIETSLFSARTEKLLWAARSETRIEKSAMEEIRPYVSLIGGKLLSENMFR